MTLHHLIVGLHSIESLLMNQPGRIIRLCVQKDRHDKKMETLIQLAEKLAVPIDYVSRDEVDSLFNGLNHQGIGAFCTKLHTHSESDLEIILQKASTPPFLLITDGIQDPHNLGACFRTADAAGVHALIAPKDRAVGITPVVTKVASGAVETVPFVQVTNLVRTLEYLKTLGIWIYGAAAEEGQTLFQTDFTGPVAIVLGAEGKGLRRLTREHCDVLVNIPLRGMVSSLNVSVAAGIFLFEVVRQRQNKT